MNLRNLHIDKTWSLFCDRDGVINHRLIGDYIKKWKEFEFLPGVLESFNLLSQIFGKIFIVTNQQGIGKGLMTDNDLTIIHDQMVSAIKSYGGRIDKIYYSPYREEEKSVFRKPGPGLARKAKIDFSEIEFENSIMVGDSITDMQFGRNAEMKTVFISKDEDYINEYRELIDFVFPDLLSFTKELPGPTNYIN